MSDKNDEPTPGVLDLVERSRVYLWNVVLGEKVAPVSMEMLGQAPSMLLLLIRCRGVFDGTDALWQALCAQPWARPWWAKSRGSVRKVYARLRKALEDTNFPLMGEGYYGFWQRANEVQRASMDHRERLRTARARATRRRKRAGREDLGRVRGAC